MALVVAVSTTLLAGACNSGGSANQAKQGAADPGAAANRPSPADPPRPDSTATPVPTARALESPAPGRAVSAGPPPAFTDAALPLLGAYYYSWYPENLAGGTLGSHLVPPAGPDGSYVSADPATAATAISQASAAGINFFALDWWPNRPQLNSRIDTGFLAAPNLESTHFAMLYETQALGPPVPYSADTPMTPAAITKLVADMVSIATDYFANPQYLRINGRPVLFWYLTRTMTGDVASAVAQVRAALARLGYNPYLVGDEIFWRVTTEGGAETTAPQVGRADLFDAITWYNLYDASNPSLAGYGAGSTFLTSAQALVAKYQAALGGSVPIVPDVIAGYNDRATRPTEDHPAIPQQWAPGAATGSFLQHMFDTVALPAVDPRAPMVMITSWNEFNEQTAIAPVPATPTTTVDDSPTGSLYTQGYEYGGSGTAVLDVVAQVAAAREVPAPAANPFAPFVSPGVSPTPGPG